MRDDYLIFDEHSKFSEQLGQSRCASYIPLRYPMNRHIPFIEEVLWVDEPLPCRCSCAILEGHNADLADAREVWICRLNVKGYESHLSVPYPYECSPHSLDEL